MSTFVLLLGISAIAAPLGFMVGGSATPVVGIILPAIFGLVVTAVSLYPTKFPSKDQLEIFTELQKNGLLTQYLELIKDQQSKAPLKIGLILLVFGVVYQLGAITGTTARTHQWFLPEQKVAPKFPWSLSKRPVSAAAAFEWITLQSGLLTLGYTNEQIAELYKIQVSEWDALEAIDKSKIKPRADAQDTKWPPIGFLAYPKSSAESPPFVLTGPTIGSQHYLEKKTPLELLEYVQEYKRSLNSNVYEDRPPGFRLDRKIDNGQ